MKRGVNDPPTGGRVGGPASTSGLTLGPFGRWPGRTGPRPRETLTREDTSPPTLPGTPMEIAGVPGRGRTVKEEASKVRRVEGRKHPIPRRGLLCRHCRNGLSQIHNKCVTLKDDSLPPVS